MHDRGGSGAVGRVGGHDLCGVKSGSILIRRSRGTSHKSSSESCDGETHLDYSSIVSK